MREYDLNLIPGDIIKHEGLKQRGKYWAYLAVGCLVLLFSINILIKAINSSISQDIVAIISVREKVDKDIAEIEQLGLEEKELLKIKEKIGHLARKGPLTEIFTNIDKAINDNILLTRLEIKYSPPYDSTEDKDQPVIRGYFDTARQGKTERGRRVGGNNVLLRGVASSNNDIASMLAELSRLPLFIAVNLKYSKIGEPRKGKSVMFEIECRL